MSSLKALACFFIVEWEHAGMTSKMLRLAYVGEFLLAVAAIFTAWPEIAGQDPLDLMPWGWKFGLGLGLSIAIVAYSQAIASQEAFWTIRSARWLASIVLLILAMGALTFYYALQEDAGETDDSSTISSVRSFAEVAMVRRSYYLRVA